MRILFPCHQAWAVYKESKEIILSLEQWKLLGVFDAVSLQCLRLVVKETICSQGRNKGHDKVAYRSMTWVYNLCRILQHVVNGFDNVSLIPNWGMTMSMPIIMRLLACSLIRLLWKAYVGKCFHSELFNLLFNSCQRFLRAGCDVLIEDISYYS